MRSYLRGRLARSCRQSETTGVAACRSHRQGKSARRSLVVSPVQKTRSKDLMVHGVPVEPENLSASHVHPDFRGLASYVVAEIKVVRPVAISDRSSPFGAGI